MTRTFLSLSRRPLALLISAVLLTSLVGCGGGKPAEESADAKPEAEQSTDKAAEQGKDGEQDKEEAEKKKEATVPVETVAVARRPISASYNGTAALEAPNEAQVVAKTSGVLLQLLIEEGQEVKAGQVLARIDPERPRLEVQRSRAMLRKLEADYARSETMVARKLVAADAHERLRYDIETQRAIVEMAELELSYTNIVAPIGGVIAQRLVKQGNLIQLNTALFRIVDTDTLEATLNVPESQLATMRAGLDATLLVDALPGRAFKGAINRVSPVVDAGSGTFRVVCRFEGEDILKPGMFARVGIAFDERADALTVPRAALLEDAGETAVFKVEDGKAVRVPVELGFTSGELAEVRSGLAEGDQVVTAGKIALRDGIKVEVIDPSGGAKAVAQAQNGANGGATSQ